jgi:tetratricopeptide (TPR) repeat protein/predicted Ser/Thr protein kinase
VAGKVGFRPALSRGDSVGRYLLLDELGQGGMGVVYKAYDPELDRPIALKLLTAGHRGVQRERLMREAQALARVSHPNVIAVHDVGCLDEGRGGNVFIAMEFVEGQTLRKWVGEGRRNLLEAFLAAGEGLLAAHRAGLVHRDFKPDNVIVGADGRVRVLDFGLARAMDASPDARREGEPARAKMLETPLTHAGAIVGTPRFMAPEQHFGAAVDERADQFSFCVSLYWALYGEFPFPGATLDEIIESLQAGRVTEPPAGAAVPRWLRQVLLTGLARRPADRYPSMAELLGALRADPSIARRRWLRAGVAVLLVGSAAFGWRAMHLRQVRVCQGAERKLAGVWDEPRRVAVRAAFHKSGLPYAETALATVEKVLDRYARAWSAMQTDACEATHVRKEQSEELLDLRMSCLGDRLTQLKTLTDLYAAADARSVERAAQSAESLPVIEACADTAALRAPIPPPRDPATRRRVEAVREQLARANALGLAGQPAQALELLRAALPEATALKYLPLEAETQLALGRQLTQHGDNAEAAQTLRRAHVAAVAGHHDEAAARSATEMVQVVGELQGHYDEGEYWGEVAEAQAARLKRKDEILGVLYTRRSALREEQSKLEAALADAKRALELQKSVFGTDHYLVADAYQQLGNVEYLLAHYREAIELHQRSLAIYERAFGPDHPKAIANLVGMADVYGDMGEHTRALGDYQRALAALARVQADHPWIATIYLNAGAELRALGRPREAWEFFRRALADWQKRIGPSTETAMALEAMGNALVDQQRTSEALATYRQAEVECRRGGPSPQVCGLVQGGIGEALRQLGKPDEALARYQRSLQALEQAVGPRHPLLVTPLLGMGLVELSRNAAARAKPPLERALAIREAQPGDGAELAEVRFALARALWDDPHSSAADRKRARELAVLARDAYDHQGGTLRRPLGQVNAWLARHG